MDEEEAIRLVEKALTSLSVEVAPHSPVHTPRMSTQLRHTTLETDPDHIVSVVPGEDLHSTETTSFNNTIIQQSQETTNYYFSHREEDRIIFGAVVSPDTLQATFNIHIDNTSPQATDSGYLFIDNSTAEAVAIVEGIEVRDTAGTLIKADMSMQGDQLLVTPQPNDPTNGQPLTITASARGTCIANIRYTGTSQGTIVHVYRASSPSAICWRAPQTVYDEYTQWAPSAYHGQKYRDQLVCHVANAWEKRPWNLESWRPNVGYEATVAAFCNP